MNKKRDVFKLDSAVRKLLYKLLLLSIFFPFVSFVHLGTDQQPYALVISILLAACFRPRLLKLEVYILLLFLCSLFVLLTAPISFQAIRSLANYGSLFFIAYVSYRVLNTRRVNFEKFFIVAVSVWLAVPLIQTLWDTNFLTFVLSASRTGEGRGVTGLAPEPTFLAVVYVFFILFTLHLQNLKYRKAIMLLLASGVILLAKSSMGALLLALMLSIYAIMYIGLGALVYAVGSVFLISCLIASLPGSRIAEHARTIIDNPVQLLLADASVNDRFFHVFFALKGFIDNAMLPNGYSSWLPYVSSQVVMYQEFVIVEWFSLGGRIMSGFGAAFYELGIFAAILPLVIVSLLYKLYQNDVRRVLFFALFVNAMMFAAIPLGFPLFGFYLGFLSHMANSGGAGGRPDCSRRTLINSV